MPSSGDFDGKDYSKSLRVEHLELFPSPSPKQRVTDFFPLEPCPHRYSSFAVKPCLDTPATGLKDNFLRTSEAGYAYSFLGECQ